MTQPTHPKYALTTRSIIGQSARLHTGQLVKVETHPNGNEYAAPVVLGKWVDNNGNEISLALYENEYTVIKGV
jgi:hypothetical protein